jgi:hypothetical protein
MDVPSAGGVAAAVEAAMLTAGQSELHRIFVDPGRANRCPREPDLIGRHHNNRN